MSDESTIAQEATIQAFPNGWKLVTVGTWAISVGPDSVIQLPRHVAPDEVDDFVAAIKAAADLGTKLKVMNEDRAQADDRSLPRGMMVTQGGTPAGYTQIPATAKNQPLRGSIGRRGHMRANHGQTPGVPAPPKPPPRGQ